MPTYHAVVHRNGPALWPEHKSLAEVLRLRSETPELIWNGTYQGNPTPASGYIFKRDWWSGKNRYETLGYAPIARYQSWDTAETTDASSAWTVCVTGDILPTYKLVITDVYREKMTFDTLPSAIESRARIGGQALKGVVIEDKSSGRSAQQTLRALAPPWLRELVFPYTPAGSKESRAVAASVWCRNGMVLLPAPTANALWLMDFEDELFSFPQSAFLDQVDAFSQLILFVENYLLEGWRSTYAHRME